MRSTKGLSPRRRFLLRTAMRWLFLLFASYVASSASAQERELITDGGFEAGGVGWAIAHDVVPSPTNRGWFLSVAGNATPLQGLPVSTEGGVDNLFVISDQLATGTMALIQQFTVPTDMPLTHLLLSFDMFANDWSSQSVFNVNQNARVDITGATTGVGVPGAADTGVLFNAYVGTDGGPLPNGFRHYEFDVLPFVTPGGTYRLRFQSTGRVGVMNVGVDNVSLLAVPEPGAGVLVAVGAMGFLAARRFRRRSR